MRGLVISKDKDFAAVLSSIVESIAGYQCSWHPDWMLNAKTDLNDQSIIIGVISNSQELPYVEQMFRDFSPTGKSPSVILIGDQFETVDKIKLLRLNVVDLLERPVNLQRIRYLVDSVALKKRQLAKVQTTPIQSTVNLNRQLQPTIRKLAAVDATLLLTGETGVGKTYVAKQIHELSKRRAKPFVTINCAAIPENLIESELFGHKRGAFTGAESNQVGKFAHAGKGTVLLDELDALPLSAQTKLLHAIEDREFHAIGSNETIHFGARIIAASNQNLQKLMKEGLFRPDLFYRLDVYQMAIPSLRDRIGEIGDFVKLFAEEFAKKHKCRRPEFSSEVLEAFCHYDWPGNLRELRNCIEHSVISSCNGSVTTTDLPSKFLKIVEIRFSPNQSTISQIEGVAIAGPFSAPNHSRQHEDCTWSKTKIEINRLLQALEQNDNNRTKAAEEMGISRAAFYKKLRRYDLA